MAVPLSFAVASFGIMVAHACAWDWEKNRDLTFYLDDQGSGQAERIAQAYIRHPIADYYKKKANEKKTYGVFENEMNRP